MLDVKLLESVRYVVDPNGQKAAVQVEMAAWTALLSYLEELEDRALLKDRLERLLQGPAASGALDWKEARNEW